MVALTFAMGFAAYRQYRWAARFAQREAWSTMTIPARVSIGRVGVRRATRTFPRKADPPGCGLGFWRDSTRQGGIGPFRSGVRRDRLRCLPPPRPERRSRGRGHRSRALGDAAPPTSSNRSRMEVMFKTVNRQQGCRDLLPNPPLQTDEAREVPLGTSSHRGAPSLHAVMTISTGPRR
jgi:hypothetical protein